MSYEAWVDTGDRCDEAVALCENGYHDLSTAVISDVADAVVRCQFQMLVNQLRQTVVVCIAEADERRVAVGVPSWVVVAAAGIWNRALANTSER